MCILLWLHFVFSWWLITTNDVEHLFICWLTIWISYVVPPQVSCLFSCFFLMTFQFSYEAGTALPTPAKKKKNKPNPEVIYKNCVCILTCLSFRHLQSTLHMMQCTYWNIFFHWSKHFLNSWTLMPFSTPAIYCFTSSAQTKCFPLRTFVIWENKKSHLGQDHVNRMGEAWG